jgi:hypothetical protein
MTLEQLARKMRLENKAIFYDECAETKIDPPCALCQAVERGIVAGLVAAQRPEMLAFIRDIATSDFGQASDDARALLGET